MKTNLDGLFKGNPELEKKGVWFQVTDKTKFLIKRFGGANTVEVSKAMTKYYKPYAKLIDKGLLPFEKEQKIMIKVFVESCLLGWEGVEIDGQEVQYSPEKAIEFFSELPELVTTLSEYAGSIESYKEELGNS